MLAARNWIFFQKSAILKNYKICAWKDDTYIAFWKLAKYQGNVREKVEGVEEEWGNVERVEEEWGKVGRVEEELSRTYLKEER